MKKLFLAAALVASSIGLVACGGGGDEPANVAANDLNLQLSPSTGQAATQPFVNVPFVFPSAVPDLGTTAPTTVTITPPPTNNLQPGGSNPGFQVVSGGQTASGILQFGSCIFVVTASTFPAGHRLAQGNTVTVNPCNINVNTAGAVANGVAITRSAALRLGAAASSGSSVTVNVNPGGNITVNGNAGVGTVTLTPVSG
ncbi:MAG TPA: hypothetical protein VHL79_07225 [Ramlibacter sp.]|jgi:hypothetical protein|nr:hypothetical protein [Ramlibacter sp.]